MNGKFKKQRNALIGYILYYLGAFLVVVPIVVFIIVVSNTSYRNDVFEVLCFILPVIGAFMLIFAPAFNIIYVRKDGRYRANDRMGAKYGNNGLIQGVPNNCSSEYDKPVTKMENIDLNETSSGIFVGTVFGQDVVFDMQRWIRKKYYIYEIILTKLLINLVNKKVIKTSQLSKWKISTTINDITLKITRQNRRTYIYKIVKGGVVKRSFLFRFRMLEKQWFIDKNDSKLMLGDFYSLISLDK